MTTGRSVADAVARLGGVATRAELIALSGRRSVDRAVEAGDVVVLARGRYAHPAADAARAAAHRLSGTVCLLSAALLHGWPVRTTPARPQVVVPRNRRVTAGRTRGIDVHRADLGPDDVVRGVTSPERTLVDCGRRLPDDEALAVFDSALRSGLPPSRLAVLARDVRGPGAPRVRDLAARASGLAANPFESGLRSIADSVAGLHVRPQVEIWAEEFLGRPDLVDDELRIALEADSFAWHGSRRALADDARRYNRLAVRGWLVLRFAWEDVMSDAPYVRGILEAAVAERTNLTESARGTA